MLSGYPGFNERQTGFNERQTGYPGFENVLRQLSYSLARPLI